MRERILIRNADAVVTCDPADRVLYNSDILICGNRIEAVGNNLAAGDAQIIDAAGKYVYPGLVNTHHHFFQAFVRNLMTIDRSELTLMQWLDDIYKVFVRIDGDVIFYASAACMADLIKHGCTCSVDHQYCYTPATGKQGVDRQMEAARLMGFRFVAARGTNTLPRWKGSTIPDEMCETTAEYLDDCQRLLALYHDPEPFSMRQIVLAPCQPINCTEDTFLETIRLARSAGVHMHTHLCEGENSSMVRRFGVRSLEWCRRIGFVGSDIWLAHGRETLPEEYALLAENHMGISHCPAPTMLGGSEILDIPGMRKAGIPISLGVDGCATNDGSNMLDTLRLADFIFRDEVAKAHLEGTMNQYFAVLTNMRSVGVMGDGRTYDYTLALRSVTTTDFMTADWTRIPYDVLDRVSVRIVNEVPHINRIVYDITSKPPATIEWE